MRPMLRPRDILEKIDHRPYLLPGGSWGLSMSWRDLLFMHWPVPVGWLRPLIPAALEIDTFDGSAWLGVVPFRMSGVRPRFVPRVPFLSDFPEINVRAYVTHGDKPGVWFFSLDAHNRLAVRLARATFHLPYFDARMSCRNEDGWTCYESVRTHRGAPGANFAGRYRPTGEVFDSLPGSLESFLTERYCLYSADSAGNIRRADVHHVMWPLQGAEAEVEALEMTAQVGVKLPDTEPVLHFARRLDVVAWPPKKVGG